MKISQYCNQVKKSYKRPFEEAIAKLECTKKSKNKLKRKFWISIKSKKFLRFTTQNFSPEQWLIISIVLVSKTAQLNIQVFIFSIIFPGFWN